MHWKKFWKNLKKAKNNGVLLPVASANTAVPAATAVPAVPIASAAPVAIATAIPVAPGTIGATGTPIVTATAVAIASTGALGVCVCVCVCVPLLFEQTYVDIARRLVAECAWRENYWLKNFTRNSSPKYHNQWSENLSFAGAKGTGAARPGQLCASLRHRSDARGGQCHMHAFCVSACLLVQKMWICEKGYGELIVISLLVADPLRSCGDNANVGQIRVQIQTLANISLCGKGQWTIRAGKFICYVVWWQVMVTPERPIQHVPNTHTHTHTHTHIHLPRLDENSANRAV